MRFSASLLAVTLGFSVNVAESQAALKLAQTIPLPGVKGRFDHFAIDLPELNQVIVANGDDGTLKILNGADFKALQSITRLNDADNLRLDPQTKLAWLG